MKKAYLYANNHFSAKSVANAAILKHQLGQPVAGEYPGRVGGSVSRSQRNREDASDAHSFTEAFLSTSAFTIFAATSIR